MEKWDYLGQDYLHRKGHKEHNQQDITLGQNNTQKQALVDITVPAGQNIIRTEEEKVEKY